MSKPEPIIPFTINSISLQNNCGYNLWAKIMRIRELLEGKRFNDLDFVTKDEDGERINYDLAEDLAFFMNNDDDTYRRHLFPSILKCVDTLKSKKETSPSFFEDAVERGYSIYIKKYPIRHLSDSLEKEMFEEICKKLHDDVCQQYEDGKYKD